MDAYREEAIDIIEDRNNGHDAIGALVGYTGTYRRVRTYE